MKVNQVYREVTLLVLIVAFISPLVNSLHPPRTHRNGPPGHPQNARNKKVKRHNLQRPIKPVYHSPPINAFSLKDLQKNVEEDFPELPGPRLPLGSRFARPGAGSNSGEERYFSSLNNQFSPNFGPQYFSPSPNLRPKKPPTSSKGSFGLYGPGFGSISELHHVEEPHHHHFEDDDDEVPFRGSGFNRGHKKPYKHNFEYTTVKPKLLVPSYVDVKPANIKHLGSSGYGYPSNVYSNKDEHEYEHKDAHYSFGYEVANHGGYGKEPQFFGHGEQRHGDVTKGKYHVLLPDGRHQKVAYTADHSGYHAEVSYTQHGHHGHRRY